MSLVPMEEFQLENCLQNWAEFYAAECIESGFWPASGASERAGSYIKSLLPEGVSSPGNLLFTIQNEEITVGTLWAVLHGEQGIPSLWIHHIEIYPEYRRQGFGRTALKEIEEYAAQLGVCSVGLHLFIQNQSALQFYRSCGFFIPGVNMVKHTFLRNSNTEP